MKNVNNELFKRRQQQWIDSNPFRRWRKANDVTLMSAASILDVSILPVRMWESGSSTPNKKNFMKLKKLLNISNLEEVWDAWKNQRPKYM